METNNGGDSSPEKNNNTHEMESSADRHGSNSDSSQPQNDDVISSQESNDGGRQSNSPAPLAFQTFSSAAYSPTYSISSTENEEEPNVPSKKGDTEADVIVIDSDESTEDLMVCMGNNDEPENAHSILDTSEDFEFNASDELPVDELPFASQPNKSQICLNSQKVSSSSDTSYSSIGRLLQSIRDSKTGSNLPDDGQVRRNVGFSSDAIENSLVVINEDENSGGSWHSSLRLSMSSQQAAAGSQQPNFWGFPDSDGTVSSTQNIESQGQDEVSSYPFSGTKFVVKECINNNSLCYTHQIIHAKVRHKENMLEGLKYDLIGSKMGVAYTKFALSSSLKKSEERHFSVRDLTMASTSSDDIPFIDDNEESSFVSALSETQTCKSNVKDFKLVSTPNEQRVLEDLIRTLAKPSNFLLFHSALSTRPIKSNLKRKVVNEHSTEKKSLGKSAVKFTNATIFYFERSQGFSSIPSKGGSTLGMTHQHFYITTLPIDEYEHKKVQKWAPMRRNSGIIYKRNDSDGHQKRVEALSALDRVQLLESSAVNIELAEEDECSEIRSSRALAGCDCKDYCDPDACSCSLSGIQCQVDRPNFPCGCTREHCKNILGRNEYNPNKVKTHFVKTMRKFKAESKGRCSKRKQGAPSKVLLNSSHTQR